MLLLLFFSLAALPALAAPLKVCFVSGSFEYDSDTALAIFEDYLTQRYDAEVTFLKADGWTNIPGLEALNDCDVALFYTRRLRLVPEQLALVQAYVEAGKPLVACRTASHGFQSWLEFDKQVLGGNYDGHLGEGPTAEVRIRPSRQDHPILQGVPSFRSRYSLYRTAPLAEDCDLLMRASTPESEGRQPAAWTRTHNGGRVFYTAFGGISDFENAAFQRMMANALFWAAEREPEAKPLPDLPAREKKQGTIELPLRSGGETLTKTLPIEGTAILICDMWDKHWCTFASERVAEMAPQMNDVLKPAREAGILIIHAPSETMAFYQDTPQRRRAQAAPSVEPQQVREVEEPPLPIDDSDGGCPEEERQYGAWTRQHPAIEIGEHDVISDDGREIYNVLEQEGIDHLIIMGVHTNMCVLGRSFAIRQMTRWGKDCYLVRDLTDTMYNPAMPPKVSHDEGTELVVKHIEQYWAPSLLSADLVAALPE
jgi:type 1 glutamine amidotransferase/nicotinamidase-related amidase